MEQHDIIQAAWALCSSWGMEAGLEADTLARQLSLIGAEPAAQIWRDVARAVRTIQSAETPALLQ